MHSLCSTCRPIVGVYIVCLRNTIFLLSKKRINLFIFVVMNDGDEEVHKKVYLFKQLFDMSLKLAFVTQMSASYN